MKIKSHNTAGQYQCEADNGIEKQSKMIVVNVNGMKLYSFINFALSNIKFNSTTKCGAKVSVL